MEDQTPPEQGPIPPPEQPTGAPPATPQPPADEGAEGEAEAPPEAPAVSAPRLIPEAPRWPQPPASTPPAGVTPTAPQERWAPPTPPTAPPTAPAAPPPSWGAGPYAQYAPPSPPTPPSGQTGEAPSPARPPRKTSKGLLIIIAIVCAVVIVGAIIVVMAVAGSAGGGGFASSGQQIGLIRIEGVISGGSSAGFLGPQRGTERVLDELKRAGKDKSVKAIVIRINSPGGSAAASQELHDAILRLRKDHGKVVVVSMSDVAASGGYYVAVAADKIVANPATMTGSIGVIIESWEIAELMEKYGVGATTVKSGEYKDTGSMFRKMNDKERELLQDMVDDVYDQFLHAVYEGRKSRLTPEQVRNLTNGKKSKAAELDIKDFKSVADGRALTGRQAEEKGLVDALGGLDTAIELAKKEAGIEGEVRTKEYGRRTPLEELLSGPYSMSREDVLREMLLRRDVDPVTRILRAPDLSVR